PKKFAALEKILLGIFVLAIFNVGLAFVLIRHLKKYLKQITIILKYPLCALFLSSLGCVAFSICRAQRIEICNFLSLCGAQDYRKFSQTDCVFLDLYAKKYEHYFSKTANTSLKVPQ